MRLATKAGHAVRVVQTPTSERFVGARVVRGADRRAGAAPTSSSATRRAARSPTRRRPTHDPLSHLELVAQRRRLPRSRRRRRTRSPSSPHGLADNLLTSAALAATCPVLVAPAMNNHMWEHPATQANLDDAARARRDVVEPGVGALGSKGE